MEPDLKDITYSLCQTAFEKTGRFKNKKEGYKFLDELISSGKALERFREIIKSQGGDDSIIDDYTFGDLTSFKAQYCRNIDHIDFNDLKSRLSTKQFLGIYCLILGAPK